MKLLKQLNDWTERRPEVVVFVSAILCVTAVGMVRLNGTFSEFQDGLVCGICGTLIGCAIAYLTEKGQP